MIELLAANITTHTVSSGPPAGAFVITLPMLLVFMLAPAALMGFVIYVVIIQSMGRSAKMAWYCKRKKMRLLFHIGLDRAMHFLPAIRGINGNLHVGAIDFLPDPTSPDASFPLGTGEGTIGMITHAHSAGTLNPEFLEYTAFATKHLSVSGNPYEAAKLMTLIMKDEDSSKARLNLYNQIFIGAKTLEEVKQQEANRLELGEDSRNIFFSEFEKDYGYKNIESGNQAQMILQTTAKKLTTKNDKNEDVTNTVQIPLGIDRLEKHLAELAKAKMITVEKKNWFIQPSIDPKTKKEGFSLVEWVEVPIDKFRYFLPSAAGPNDVHSYGVNKEAQGKMENEFTTGTAMKWFTLGFVALLIGVGVYIILQGLHIG